MDLAGNGRQNTVEPGDEVSVRFADGAIGGLLTVPTDVHDSIARALIGKRLHDNAELQRGGSIQNGTVEHIIKTAGRILVPFLGDGVTTATVSRWYKNYGERVSSGERLVALKVGKRRIEVQAPISGFLNSISQPMGNFVKPGNRLGRIEYQEAPFGVRYSLVKPDDLPLCLRIDYQIGWLVEASEWVSPDATGSIGENGRAWWRDRAGTVPATPEDALELAKQLPAPFQIDIEKAVHDRPPTITGFWYASNVEAKSVFLSGDNSVVLPSADTQQLQECRKAFRLGPTVSYHLDASPSWWPRIPINQDALSNPFDRHAVSPHAQSLLRQALDDCRDFFVDNPDKQIRFRQAIRNMCMAYSLSEAPNVDELSAFFPSLWPRNDLVLVRHWPNFCNALRKIVRPDWLNRIIDPIMLDILSKQEYMRAQYAKSLGIGTAGRINSGLNWGAKGYYFGEAWVPCIDIEGVFFAAMSANRPETTSPESGGARFPSFRDALREALREAINTVRDEIGLPRIGEGWLTETDLFNRIKALVPGETVIHQGQPKWLGRQRFDIWIPTRNLAIEYHGEQHFVEISVFGGKAGLAKTQERDAKKRRLCLENSVKLIEIAFNDDLRDDWLKSRIGIQEGPE